MYHEKITSNSKWDWGPTVRPEKVANWAPDSWAPGPSCPGPNCPPWKSGKLGPEKLPSQKQINHKKTKYWIKIQTHMLPTVQGPTVRSEKVANWAPGPNSPGPNLSITRSTSRCSQGQLRVYPCPQMHLFWFEDSERSVRSIYKSQFKNNFYVVKLCEVSKKLWSCRKVASVVIFL